MAAATALAPRGCGTAAEGADMCGGCPSARAEVFSLSCRPGPPVTLGVDTLLDDPTVAVLPVDEPLAAAGPFVCVER